MSSLGNAGTESSQDIVHTRLEVEMDAMFDLRLWRRLGELEHISEIDIKQEYKFVV